MLKKKGKKKDRTPSISESSEFPWSPSGDVMDEEEEEDKGHESGSDTSSTYDLVGYVCVCVCKYCPALPSKAWSYCSSITCSSITLTLTPTP